MTETKVPRSPNNQDHPYINRIETARSQIDKGALHANTKTVPYLTMTSKLIEEIDDNNNPLDARERRKLKLTFKGMR